MERSGIKALIFSCQTVSPVTKAHCRLPISDNCTFSLAVTAAALFKRNLSKSAFSEGVGHFNVAADLFFDRIIKTKTGFSFSSL